MNDPAAPSGANERKATAAALIARPRAREPFPRCRCSARGLATGNPVQRAWRDAHAVGQHIGPVWDVQAGLYGSVALGYPCPDPKL